MGKKIKILTSGPIRAKGLIYGPVLTPFMETEDNIFTLLAAGVEIVEVLPDGKEVKLSMMNFKNDNAFVPDQDPVAETPVVEDPVVEIEPVVEDVVVEDAVEVTIETPVVEETTEEEVIDENVTIEPKAEKFVPEKQNEYKNKKQHGKQYAKDNK